MDVVIIIILKLFSESLMDESKNEVFSSSKIEKEVRGRLKSEVIRSVLTYCHIKKI